MSFVPMEEVCPRQAEQLVWVSSFVCLVTVYSNRT